MEMAYQAVALEEARRQRQTAVQQSPLTKEDRDTLPGSPQSAPQSPSQLESTLSPDISYEAGWAVSDEAFLHYLVSTPKQEDMDRSSTLLYSDSMEPQAQPNLLDV